MLNEGEPAYSRPANSWVGVPITSKQKCVQEKAIERPAEGGGCLTIADDTATFCNGCIITSMVSAGCSDSQGRSQKKLTNSIYYLLSLVCACTIWVPGRD